MALISIETERKLADFLLLIAEGENEIEKSRISLCGNREFEPLSVFRQLDRFSNGYLNFLDIQEFFENKRIETADKDIQLLIRQYDSDSDGRLLISDFYQIVLPSTNTYLRESVIARPSYMKISLDVEYLLIRLLEKEALFQRQLESSRYSLTSQIDYKHLDAFRCINYANESFITRDHLAEFFRRHSLPVYEEDIDAILRRVDTDGDERISYAEFVEAVQASEILLESPYRSIASPVRHSSPLRKSFSPNRSSYNSRSLESSYRKTPIKSVNISEIAQVLSEQVALSRELDAAIKELGLRADFNLIDAYRMFDIDDKGFFTELDAEETLNDFGIRTFKDEISLLFKHYCHSSDKKMRFSELNELFTPKDPEYARLVKNRVPYNAQGANRRNVFRPETMNKLIRVLQLHLECESMAENLRQRLSRSQSFNIMDAFQIIDRDRNGYITFKEFQQILDEHGLIASKKDVESLMERYDKDKDGRVSYSEFMNEVTPKSPQKY
ncbi:unnamed protein product [Blepharisma stoltei]|uniref:EF-hand domain-containing protein n=1 Tax=Blepharisma stoltei TaxID=1481888 RepID=A0AAU9I3T8_9CILI|nr:unnamed protein product [Blepharisma stoltei]